MSSTRGRPVELGPHARRTRASRSTATRLSSTRRELRADVEVDAGDVEAERARAARSRASAASGASPNFDSSCAVWIDWCVTASTPGVRRTSTRRTPAAAARAGSSGASSTTVAPASAAARSSSSDLLLPWKRIRSPVEPGRLRERELAERRDVGADALLGEQPQQRDVRERLRPVDDERAGRGLAVRARLRADRLLAVDDERRPVLRRRAARAGTPPSVSSPSSIRRDREELEHGGSLPVENRREAGTSASPWRTRAK